MTSLSTRIIKPGKLTKCLMAIIIGILVLLLSVTFRPLRNRIFHPFLPGALAQLSTYRLIQVYYNEGPQHPVVSTQVSCHDIQDTMKLGQWGKFESELDNYHVYDDSYFQRMRNNLTMYGISLPEFERIERHYRFKPSLTSQMQKELQLTFKVLIHTFDLFNVTYFAKGGAMIGAYRHHGPIPWDDDLDVCLRASDWLKVKQILSCVPGFEVFTGSDLMFKFYYKKSPLWKGETQIRFPFIDLFFLSEDEEYTWSKHTFKVFFKKSDIYPLKFLPFGDIFVAVPGNVDTYMHEVYDAEKTCSSNYYSHTLRYFDYFYKNIPCRWLYGVYPFVKRKRIVINGKYASVQLRMLGQKELSRYIYTL